MDNQPLYDAAQAQLFLNTLLKHLPDAFCLIYDQNLRFIEAQGGALQRTGGTEMVGRTLRETVSAETADAVEPAYRAALAGEASAFDIPFAGGIYASQVLPVRDASGAVVAGMVIANDVTDKRQIADQARRYETIVENAADAVYVYDLNGNVSYANPAAADILGVASPDELIGTSGRSWISPDDLSTIDEAMETLIQQGIWRGRVTSVGPTGKRALAESVSFLLTDDQGRPNGTATFARDVTALAREEEQRAEMQRQIIDAQQATLRELSTPLIPLADNVVVMPLVGTIDSRRAGQIMETLLEGVAANQADIALLDISGVRVVDTQVADALLRAAKAAKLLGTRIVLTGIRAEVAQTIVHLGADMTEIVTRSNLQEGLRYALAEGGSDMAPGLRMA